MDGGETTGGRRSDSRGRRKRKKNKKRGASSWLLPSSWRKLTGFLLCLSSPQVDDDESRRHRSVGTGSTSSPPPSCFPWLRKGQRRQGPVEECGGREEDAAEEKRSADEGQHATEAAASSAAEKRAMAAEMISTVVVEAVKPSFLQKLFSKDYRLNDGQRGLKDRKQGAFRSKDNRSSVGPISRSTVNTCLKPNPIVNKVEPNPKRAGNPMHSENQTPQLVSLLPNQKQVKPTASPFGSTTDHVISAEKESRQGSTLGNSSLSGLLVVMTMLWMLLLGGRVVAVIFTCFLFYLLPLIMPRKPPKGESLDDNKTTIEVDYDSKEYKKKVLMEGLLERNGRKHKPTVRFT